MNRKMMNRCIGGSICIAGLIAVAFTRSSAIAEGAASGAKMAFSLSLIVTLVGITILLTSLLPKAKKTDVRTLTMAAMFAALCYIGFAYLRIDIPVGTQKTAFHLGNVFCVMAALFIGGLWGGLAGAVGLTISDLTTAYVTSAPKTFLLKLCIGLVTGLIAHKVFKLSQEKTRKVSIPVATVLACVGGMGFNVIADPLVGYFYKMYVLGVPQSAADIWVKMGAITTLVNAVIAVVVSSVLYLALRPALAKANLLPKV